MVSGARTSDVTQRLNPLASGFRLWKNQRVQARLGHVDVGLRAADYYGVRAFFGCFNDFDLFCVEAIDCFAEAATSPSNPKLGLPTVFAARRLSLNET